MRVFVRQLGPAVTMAVLAAALTARTSAQEWAFGAPQQEVKVVERFDTDGDKRLNAEERRAARASMGGWSSPPGRMGFALPAAVPGPRLMPSQVKSYRDEPVYDLATLRTFFVRFDAADWEQELMAFYNTDVEVPPNVTVDGTSFRDVGAHFRGMSSYRMVPEGFKHSLNLSFDLRARYLGYIRDIAQQWLDWTKLEPIVTEYQALIAADVKTDTRKLDTFEAFHKGVATLRTFVEERRAFLLKYDEGGARAKAPALQASVARGLQASVARGLQASVARGL